MARNSPPKNSLHRHGHKSSIFHHIYGLGRKPLRLTNVVQIYNLPYLDDGCILNILVCTTKIIHFTKNHYPKGICIGKGLLPNTAPNLRLIASRVTRGSLPQGSLKAWAQKIGEAQASRPSLV